MKILVIGDIMIDHYIYGTCNRISPEAPVPIVEIESEEYTLGGAGNVLKNLIILGCKSDIVSVVGDDTNSAILLNELADIGIFGEGIVKDPSRSTTIKTRILVTNHQLMRLDRENVNPIDAVQEKQIMQILDKNIKSYNLVLLSDYNKGVLSKSLLNQVIDTCNKVGIKTIVDPKGSDFSRYYGVSIIKPNKKEATIASGITITNKETLIEACEKIKEITNCETVIVTMSEDGIAIYTNNLLTMIPTKALDVVDVTGAGDTVLASLALSLASGNSVQVACDFANHAAAIVVSKVGSATASLDEINNFFLINTNG